MITKWVCVLGLSLSLLALNNLPVKKQYINAKVVRVYDGDTFYVNIAGWHPIVGENMPVRVRGLDSPEIKSKEPSIKADAYEAKELLMSLIKDKKVKLYNVGRDKYFRLDADVVVGGESIKGKLIDSKLYHEYDGGTKKPFNP